MDVDGIKVEELLKSSSEMLSSDELSSLPPDMRGNLSDLIRVVEVLSARLQMSSRNSNLPPSKDMSFHSPRKVTKPNLAVSSSRRPGGQKGHSGSTLLQVKNPDEIKELSIDRRTLPIGRYHIAGYESRQVFDIRVSRYVIEYRAEVLEERESGERYVATFPEDLSSSVRYSNVVKTRSVYMSIFQLIPLDRLSDLFSDQFDLPISKGSIHNFNKEAGRRLQKMGFESWARSQLLASPVNHSDETSVKVGGSRHWLHGLSNEQVTLYHVDKKRGREAMDKMKVLPYYQGVLCHDHWKPYYIYKCKHSLCNAHHIRELRYAFEYDKQKWAKKMGGLLDEINTLVGQTSSNCLSQNQATEYSQKYDETLKEAEKECPAPPEGPKGKKGVPKRTKSRNLLERLRDYKEDVLRFMKQSEVPFTNNLAEGDIRVAKIHQNISKCFRKTEGARNFCLVRGFLVTARKNGMRANEALSLLFQGKTPPFMQK